VHDSFVIETSLTGKINSSCNVWVTCIC